MTNNNQPKKLICEHGRYTLGCTYIASKIRSNFMNKSRKELAKHYNISKSLVAGIQRGELWQPNI